MRFDDTLGTVLGGDLSTPTAAQAAWRQIVDLIGRRRVAADPDALARLEALRSVVPVEVRSASARALFGASPPLALVRVLAGDDVAVSAPILRGADMPAEDWIALLPELSPRARAVLRHRRDLPPAVERALASFGPADFVLDDRTAAVTRGDVPAASRAEDVVAPVMTVAADKSPFVSVGSIALGLPVVAEALRRENDNEAPPRDESVFRIADVVARLEAFQRRREEGIPPAAADAPVPLDRGLRFETDASGTVRWVEGVARGALLGLVIARPARPRDAGVDGAASGAFRRRTRFTDAHLAIAGEDEASGRWLISGVPAFDAASGRFTGYRCSGRRPAQQRTEPTSDSLRQLVHELRTPTNAIAGFSEMIEHQLLGPVDAAYRGQAAAMHRDAGGLLAAIDDLDAAARIASGALPLHAERVALEPLLRRIVAEVTPMLAAGARLEIEGGTRAALVDARALERLVARVLGTVAATAGADERLTVSVFDAEERIGLSVTRPASLDAYPGEALLAIDDEDSPATLLGIGFALRLARNLARELGGRVRFGHRHVTIYLPAFADGMVEQARAL